MSMPYDWLLLQIIVGIGVAAIFQTSSDAFALQCLLRTNKRYSWYVMQIIACVIQVAIIYILGIIVSVSAYSISLCLPDSSLCRTTSSDSLQWLVDASVTRDCTILLLPLLSMAIIAVFQLAITTKASVVFALLGAVAYKFLSIYQESSVFLLADTCMLQRTMIRLNNDETLLVQYVVLAILAILPMIVRLLCFRHNHDLI